MIGRARQLLMLFVRVPRPRPGELPFHEQTDGGVNPVRKRRHQRRSNSHELGVALRGDLIRARDIQKLQQLATQVINVHIHVPVPVEGDTEKVVGGQSHVLIVQCPLQPVKLR